MPRNTTRSTTRNPNKGYVMVSIVPNKSSDSSPPSKRNSSYNGDSYYSSPSSGYGLPVISTGILNAGKSCNASLNINVNVHLNQGSVPFGSPFFKRGNDNIGILRV